MPACRLMIKTTQNVLTLSNFYSAETTQRFCANATKPCKPCKAPAKKKVKANPIKAVFRRKTKPGDCIAGEYNTCDLPRCNKYSKASLQECTPKEKPKCPKGDWENT